MAKQKLNWTILLYRLLPSLTNFMFFFQRAFDKPGYPVASLQPTMCIQYLIVL